MIRYKFHRPLDEVEEEVDAVIGNYLDSDEEERYHVESRIGLFSETVYLFDRNGDFGFNREVAKIRRITWSPLRRREGLVIVSTNDRSIISEDELYLAAGCDLEKKLDEVLSRDLSV